MSGNLNSPLFGPQLPIQTLESVQTYEPFGPPTDARSPDPSIEKFFDNAYKKTGIKFDQEKLRMDLLDPEFLEDVSKVLTYGSKKYNAHNWRGGLNYSRIIGAIYRHLTAINKGEDIDPDSGLSHTSHLGANVQFLNWMMKHRPDLDDRWKS